MPYVGSMFKSDTAMLRPGTRYVKDLPQNANQEALRLDPRCQGLKQIRPMPKAWREALDTIEAILERYSRWANRCSKPSAAYVAVDSTWKFCTVHTDAYCK